MSPSFSVLDHVEASLARTAAAVAAHARAFDEQFPVQPSKRADLPLEAFVGRLQKPLVEAEQTAAEADAALAAAEAEIVRWQAALAAVTPRLAEGAGGAV